MLDEGPRDVSRHTVNIPGSCATPGAQRWELPWAFRLAVMLRALAVQAKEV